MDDLGNSGFGTSQSTVLRDANSNRCLLPNSNLNFKTKVPKLEKS